MFIAEPHRTDCSASCYSSMGLFSTDPVKKLEKQHRKLLDEAFKMSKINRKRSDELTAQAAEIEEELMKLRNGSS